MLRRVRVVGRSYPVLYLPRASLVGRLAALLGCGTVNFVKRRLTITMVSKEDADACAFVLRTREGPYILLFWN